MRKTSWTKGLLTKVLRLDVGITIDLLEDVIEGVWVNVADDSPTSYEDEASEVITIPGEESGEGIEEVEEVSDQVETSHIDHCDVRKEACTLDEVIPSEDSSDSNFVVKDLDFYREIFVSLAEDTKNKDEENVRMRAYIGELESQNKRLDNKCDRLQVESEASDEKTVMIALNNPPGIIQTYSKIDILSPYIITPIYEDPEKHIVLT